MLFYQQYRFANSCLQGRKTFLLRMVEYFSWLGGLMLFVSTVAAFYCFFIRLLGASEQKPKREYFRFYYVSQATIISGAFAAR